MNEPDYARRAARVLAQAPLPNAPAADAGVERAAIAAMEDALRASTPRAARRPMIWAALAAALLAVVSATLAAVRWARHEGANVVVSASSVGTFSVPGQQPQPLVAGASLPLSSRVVTPAGGTAALDFSTGTRLELGEGSELTLDALGDRQLLHVASGRVAAKVAHVTTGGAFIVGTRDAEIEVKGTRFTVEVMPLTARCSATVTRVSVDEGVVAVHFDGRDVTLRAGERWPSNCFTTAIEPGSDATSPASSLAAQNDLFAQAVTLKRQGDSVGAISLFEHLMEAWPQGPLAESAEVERMKLLAAANAQQGAEAAHAYLAHYPTGFARADAAVLTHSPK